MSSLVSTSSTSRVVGRGVGGIIAAILLPTIAICVPSPLLMTMVGDSSSLRRSSLNIPMSRAVKAGAASPRFYVKEVFFPQYLAASPDGQRVWLSTYTGLSRLDGIK